ncbi:hypothetical protein JJD41_18480 [Oxynema sp. CENA135]|uniref:hypothetical protein n=1 Tax=Oxynema sp. CENA135 TaxID=984206 RepID=UPI00190E1370|nr:hypothetical protein [Oxynema sp. CENA135]MBK4731840.1 hypothetical protein [Oxynema sp. CENA135]
MTFTTAQNTSLTRSIWRGGAISLVLTGLLLPFAAPLQAGELKRSDRSTIENIEERSDRYLGQEVTVRGEAANLVEPNTFKLTSDNFLEGEEILVINNSGEPFVLPFDDGVAVQVTGEVRELEVAQLERDFDIEFWESDLYLEYQQQPAIVAESIALAPDPGDIEDYPNRFYNMNLAVEGEVEEILAPGVFKLEEHNFLDLGGSDLLVINPTVGDFVRNGEDLVVTGQLRSFDLYELERDYNLDWDLGVQEQIEAEFTNKPVLIVDEIYSTD